MNCPDWRALSAWRESDSAAGPSPRRRASETSPQRGANEREWRSALEHLDDCEECQDEALAADPTVLFRRLPTFEAGADEVAAMQRAVASMRRGQTIERRRPTLRRSLLRVAALAAVLMGSVLLRGAGVPLPEIAEPATAAELDLEWLPLVETTDPEYSSIIQVVDDEISLVVVLPSNADV